MGCRGIDLVRAQLGCFWGVGGRFDLQGGVGILEHDLKAINARPKVNEDECYDDDGGERPDVCRGNRIGFQTLCNFWHFRSFFSDYPAPHAKPSF
jgi:hypothetical protein